MIDRYVFSFSVDWEISLFPFGIPDCYKDSCNCKQLERIIKMPFRTLNGSRSLSLSASILEIAICFNEPGCHKRPSQGPWQKSMRFNISLLFLRSFLDIPPSLDHSSESDRNDESIRRACFTSSDDVLFSLMNRVSQFAIPLLQTPEVWGLHMGFVWVRTMFGWSWITGTSFLNNLNKLREKNWLQAQLPQSEAIYLKVKGGERIDG